jgi:hypothetical protein
MLWNLAGVSKLTSFGGSHNRDDYVWLRSTGDDGGWMSVMQGSFFKSELTGTKISV